MTPIYEFFITRYKKGTHPHSDGAVIWSRIFFRDEYEKREKAIKRLFRSIEKCDDELAYLITTGVKIRKVKYDAAFNDMGEIIVSKKIKKDEATSLRAAKRLAAHLQKSDAMYMYIASTQTEERGTIAYLSGLRPGSLHDADDKVKIIKGKIRGRKSALTRAINQAKKVRSAHAITLFPDEYKTDPKFVRLLGTLSAKRERLKIAKKMTLIDVDDTSCEYSELAGPSLQKMIDSQAESAA